MSDLKIQFAVFDSKTLARPTNRSSGRPGWGIFDEADTLWGGPYKSARSAPRGMQGAKRRQFQAKCSSWDGSDGAFPRLIGEKISSIYWSAYGHWRLSFGEHKVYILGHAYSANQPKKMVSERFESPTTIIDANAYSITIKPPKGRRKVIELQNPKNFRTLYALSNSTY